MIAAALSAVALVLLIAGMVRYTRGVEQGLNEGTGPTGTVKLLKERVEVPAFSAPDLDGRPVSTASLRGKVVLVNFWATWCEPCRDEMPSMQKLEERLHGQPFVILGVNHGEAESRVREFAERMRIGFGILVDPTQDTAKAWRVRILPASFLVARDGRVRYRVIGEMDWASDEAVSVVRALLR